MNFKNVKGKEIDSGTVKRFMMRLLRTTKDYSDESGADTNSLADAAADHFDLYGASFSVPAGLVELASEAAKEVDLSK